jgi:lactate racemase
MLVSLPYSSGFVEIDIPDHNIGYYQQKQNKSVKTDNLHQMNHALDNPLGRRLEDLIMNKNVMCLIYDASRKVPQIDFLNATFPRLIKAKSVNVILTTGTHDSETPENKAIISDVAGIARSNKLNVDKLLIHDCHKDKMAHVGRTKSHGNDIYINEHLQYVDIFLVFSDMKNHYFAGYSNAIKNFFPGVAGYNSIERNHSLAMDTKSKFGYHPLHPEPSRRNNPLAQDMLEAYHLVKKDKPVFLLATVTSGMDIVWVKAGKLEQVLPLGISEVDKHFSVKVNPTDNMIVSSGGYPNDESLYMAQRALELTRAGVNDGGEILFLAECRNGIGPKKSIENFYQPLTDAIDDILKKFENRKYIMYAHKTYKFALMIKELKKIYVKSTMTDKSISKIHLTPVSDAQNIINNWIKNNPDTKINIFGEGNKISVHRIDI